MRVQLLKGFQHIAQVAVPILRDHLFGGAFTQVLNFVYVSPVKQGSGAASKFLYLDAVSTSVTYQSCISLTHPHKIIKGRLEVQTVLAI